MHAADVANFEAPGNVMPQAFEGEFHAPLQPHVRSQLAAFPTEMNTMETTCQSLTSSQGTLVDINRTWDA